MKLIEYRNLPLSLALVLVTCLTLSVPPCGPAAEGAKNGEKPDGAGMRASEWGTFTTCTGRTAGDWNGTKACVGNPVNCLRSSTAT